MADIAGVVVGAVVFVAQCLSQPGGRRFNRWREFKRKFKILKTEVKTLKAERTSLQRRVNLAKENGDGIEENVQNWMERAEEIEVEIQNWLERASKIIGEDQEARKIRKDAETAAAGESGRDAEIAAAAADVIREDIQAAAAAAREIGEGEETVAAAGDIRADEDKTAAKKRCFKGLRNNLKSRYQLSKEAEKLLEDVVKHLEAGKFDIISYPVIPKDPRLSSKDYEVFKSRTSTLKNVISSLCDPNVNIVGIYGMGGIGKTTLAKEVANQSETNKLFDLVIFVEVTEKPDEMKIQREIAERLGLTLSSEEAEAIRAGKLCQLLKNEKENKKKQNEKKILIIFDNIWVHLDLQAIGIPLGDECKLCKVLLTSRSIDLLEKMDSQQNFPVELLDDEEAWQLFKKMSRDNIEGSEFESVAKEVANKCARLPTVIVIVARALRNKELFEWEDALQQMKTHSSENMLDIRKSIELSYNYLSPVLKKTIMLIRYANLTSIDELLMFGMGLDLFERIDKLEGRRTRVRTLVKQLKDSCLLLDGNTTDEDFSMHDVVRDAVISIASREGHVFTNELIDELVWPDKNTLKDCHSIVLNDVKTSDLPQVLKCQHLKLLSVSAVHFYSDSDSDSDSDSSLNIRDDFFTRMSEIKVLVLNNMELLSLPSSLRFLKNLRALGLYNCRLDDIAIIGDLKKLEILSLKNSVIKKLPVEVGHLTRLKSLDLRGFFYLGVIAPNVLSSLSHLEELYMGDFHGWEEEGPNKDRENTSLDELKYLSKLTCLEVKIQDAKTLPRDLVFNKLERYEIMIGPNRRLFYEDGIGIPKSCRNFSLSLINTNICLNDGHIMQLKKIEDLCLFGSQDMKNVLYGLDRDGFQHLKYLQVIDNDNLLCIVDSMKYASNNAFPVLESLIIQNLINLEKIYCGQLTTESSFSKLRKIEVEGCAKLKNIFSFSIARRLQLLQSIDISDCKNIEEIFAIEREDESNCNSSEMIDNIELNQLHSLHLSYLPQFKSLEYNSNCSNTLFRGKVALPSLEVLELNGINVERIWQNPDAAMSCGIQNLTKLILRCCNNLKWLFSSSMIGSFDRLQYLEIYKCPALEEIMVIDEEDGLGKEERKNNVAFSISNINNYLKMEVWGCHKLKTLFPQNMYRKFLRLESLSVFDCGLLEVIFDLKSPDFEDKHSAVVITELSELDIAGLPKLKQVWNNDPKIFVSFEKLKEVRIVGCDVLKNVFPASVGSSLSQLESLHISECGVEEIIFVDEEEAETNSKFAFPRLISLQLSDLPNFTTFFSERYTTKWSASFLVGKIFPNLEKLTVKGKSIPRIWHFLEDLFCKLKYLRVTFDGLTIISSLDFLQRFHSIERLEIIGGKFLIWSDENVENEMSATIRNLNECFDLQHILKEASNMNHLFHLNVRECDNLVNLLIPSLTSFRNLTTLVVHYCHALTSIVTSSTAKSMGQLREMKIIECNMIAELLLADEGDEANDYEIVFRELKELHIECLQSLTSFCSANYTLKFPSLEELIVFGCPNMKSFSRGKLSTPKLQKVKHCGNNQFEDCWKRDLNTTIQQLHEEMYKRRGLIMTSAKEDVSSSSNNMKTQSSKED